MVEVCTSKVKGKQMFIIIQWRPIGMYWRISPFVFSFGQRL